LLDTDILGYFATGSYL